MEITRCNWAGATDALYLSYHDQEWGVPVQNDGHNPYSIRDN